MRGEKEERDTRPLGINAGGERGGLGFRVNGNCLLSEEGDALVFSAWLDGWLLSFVLLCFWGALKRKGICKKFEKEMRPHLKETRQIKESSSFLIFTKKLPKRYGRKVCMCTPISITSK